MNIPHTKKLCWIFLMLVLSINMLSLDMYLPAMPSMAAELHTTPFFLKLIFIINFIELSISPLMIGPFADIKGRKPAVFACLILSVVGQFLSAMSINASFLMIARFIQYLGAGALSSIILTLICDNFEKDKRAKAIALFEIALPLAVALGPLLGATMLGYVGWRGSFLLFSMTQLLSFLIIFSTLSETLKSSRKINIKDACEGMLNVLKDPLSARIILILGFTEGGWMIFTISSAFFYIQTFNLGFIPYACYQTVPVLFFFLGLGSYRFLIGKLEAVKLFNIGLLGYVLFGIYILFFIGNLITPTPENLCFLITGMNFFSGFISPNGNAIVLSRSNKNLMGTSAATFTAVINLIVGGAMLCGNYIVGTQLSLTFFNCLLFVVCVSGLLGFNIRSTNVKTG